MLDLDRLFPDRSCPVCPPGNSAASPLADDRSNRPENTASAGPVPSDGRAGNKTESLAWQGFGADSPASTAAEAGHSGHSAPTPDSDSLCPPKALTTNRKTAFGTVGALGTVPRQRGEEKNSPTGPGEGATGKRFALHPAAVILLLEYAKKASLQKHFIIRALSDLDIMPPDEQLKTYHQACLDAGLKPWLLLTPPAPTSGHDCTVCSHLVTHQYPGGTNGRRLFNWACKLGYLILETGRGSERIWIAPPECESWERWRPTDQR